jgi:hypothetical protein
VLSIFGDLSFDSVMSWSDQASIDFFCPVRFAISFYFFHERRAHAPLGAGSRVTHGVEVVITGNHLNESAPSGCVARLVVLLFVCQNWLSASVKIHVLGLSRGSVVSVHG